VDTQPIPSGVLFKENDQRPVERVSWLDAIVFCNTLSGLLKLTPVYQRTYDSHQVTMDLSANGIRLPTGEEWQRAASGGDQGVTYAGSDLLLEVGWYIVNSDDTTHPVSQNQANGYGLFDMSGNVEEWANDDYETAEYRPSANRRPVHGGSWRDDADKCAVSYRDDEGADGNNDNRGFRLSRSVGGVSSGGEVSADEPAGVDPSTEATVYEANGVQFRMRDIPAGDGIESFLMAEERPRGSEPAEYVDFALERTARPSSSRDHSPQRAPQSKLQELR
jgi:hypothetical protein